MHFMTCVCGGGDTWDARDTRGYKGIQGEGERTLVAREPYKYKSKVFVPSAWIPPSTPPARPRAPPCAVVGVCVCGGGGEARRNGLNSKEGCGQWGPFV
jgi:hypothetical protein